MLYLSQGKYQWAGEEGTNANLPPNCNAQSAWAVATTTDWASIGWEIIYNPTLDQIKEGDIFTISPSASGIWSGHTGIVYAKHADGTIVTLEQNYNGKRYVQKLYSNNSYYVFNGFSCIVRPKTNSNPNIESDEDMKIISITTNGDYYGVKYKAGACFHLTGDSIRYIERPKALDNLKSIGIGFYKMSAIDFLYIIQDLNLKII
ncbi:CHAP domain-containing protein [Lactococcus petauri]|uniref:CHAP domain-containing protein n=1 Tax=Lactococcus petauri TaxID=1940789 RepID=UPI0021F1BA83|nr:CHAP domain-containing protein [Lactococcus petauri]MCV5953895.1 CHAP domain-containing protein [Lactococcus petauri]